MHRKDFGVTYKQKEINRHRPKWVEKYRHIGFWSCIPWIIERSYLYTVISICWSSSVCRSLWENMRQIPKAPLLFCFYVHFLHRALTEIKRHWHNSCTKFVRCLCVISIGSPLWFKTEIFPTLQCNQLPHPTWFESNRDTTVSYRTEPLHPFISYYSVVLLVVNMQISNSIGNKCI